MEEPIARGAGSERSETLMTWIRESAMAVAKPVRDLLPLAALVMPELAIAAALSNALGGVAGRVAERDAREKVDRFGRALERTRRLLFRYRHDLHDDQVADLLARPDVLRFFAEARDQLAVEERDARMERFAVLLAERATSREPHEGFDGDLHLARATLDLGDGSILALQKLVEALDADDRGERGSVAEDVPHGLTSAMDLRGGGRLGSASELAEITLSLAALVRWDLAVHTAILGRGAPRIGADDGSVVQTPPGRWYATDLGREFLSRISAPD